MKTILFLAGLLAATTTFAQEKPEGLFINSKAADFKGKDQNGNDVSMKELRKKGSVVVIFYRGNWCPYCNKELKRFQDSLQFITAKKASVIAISPETGEGIKKTVEKTGASFPLLYDQDMKISKAYGVSFEVDEKTRARYKNSGIDLLETNHQKDKAFLPVPAVYIVNRDGSVVYRFFDSDYRKRVSVAEILSQL